MIKFSESTLDNGLKVIHHRDESVPLVCVNVLYDVGARDEDEDKTGFAHLFEHLMFGGSINIPNYDEPLQKVGGENNAFTTNDLTNYYLTVPYPNVETGFWLESDRMLSLAFSEKSLEVQRNVVIEEFKQRYLNQPYGDVWLLMRPLAYKHHPYKWDTIGKEISHIENARMEDVKDFFNRFYNPSNATLVIAGSIGFEQCMDLARKWFEPISPGVKFKRVLTPEPAQTEKRSLKVTRPVPVSALYKVWHMPCRMDPDYHAWDLLSDIFGRGNSSRLQVNLVQKKKIFSEINMSVSGDLDPGLLVFSGKLLPGISPEAGEEALEEELEKFRKNGAGEQELGKVINKAESSLIFSEISLQNRAFNLALASLMGNTSMINEEAEKYRKVKKEQLTDIMLNKVVDSNASVVYYNADL